MRFTTWNCCRRFDEKLAALLPEQPTVAVIQECSKASLQTLLPPYQGHWLGGPEGQGLGMLCREPYRVDKVAFSELATFACVDLEGPRELRIIAAWNCPPEGESYPGHLHNFLDAHQDWFTDQPLIFAGDLNSQTGASCDRGPRKHADLVRRLEAFGIFDAYAHRRDGGPREPTYRHQRRADKPFHLDYIFASEQLLMGATLEVGSADAWSKLSDHSPVTLITAD